MTRRVYRIAKTKYCDKTLDGEGARIYPGRWNSRGVPMVYCASTPSLALLEILVHLEDGDMLLNNYSLLTAECPASEILSLAVDDLPDDWNDDPAPPSTREIGDDWIAGKKSLMLEVPSVIVPVDRVYLVNPVHPDIKKLMTDDPQPPPVDSRLLSS